MHYIVHDACAKSLQCTRVLCPHLCESVRRGTDEHGIEPGDRSREIWSPDRILLPFGSHQCAGRCSAMVGPFRGHPTGDLEGVHVRERPLATIAGRCQRNNSVAIARICVDSVRRPSCALTWRAPTILRRRRSSRPTWCTRGRAALPEPSRPASRPWTRRRPPPQAP
jgi:hypothetical protein